MSYVIKTHGSKLWGQEEYAYISSGLRNQYSELFTHTAALSHLSSIAYLNDRPSTF